MKSPRLAYIISFVPNIVLSKNIIKVFKISKTNNFFELGDYQIFKSCVSACFCDSQQLCNHHVIKYHCSDFIQTSDPVVDQWMNFACDETSLVFRHLLVG